MNKTTENKTMFHSFKDMGHILTTMYGKRSTRNVYDETINLSNDQSVLSVLCHISNQLTDFMRKFRDQEEINTYLMTKIQPKFDAVRKANKNAYYKNRLAMKEAVKQLQTKYGKDNTDIVCKALMSRTFKANSFMHELDRDGYMRDISEYDFRKNRFVVKTPEWFIEHLIRLIEDGTLKRAEKQARKIGLIK
jgi:nitrate/nitrite-specific signal transduction histidine kinase